MKAGTLAGSRVVDKLGRGLFRARASNRRRGRCERRAGQAVRARRKGSGALPDHAAVPSHDAVRGQLRASPAGSTGARCAWGTERRARRSSTGARCAWGTERRARRSSTGARCAWGTERGSRRSSTRARCSWDGAYRPRAPVVSLVPRLDVITGRARAARRGSPGSLRSSSRDRGSSRARRDRCREEPRCARPLRRPRRAGRGR